jgi:hypothetical protein
MDITFLVLATMSLVLVGYMWAAPPGLTAQAPTSLEGAAKGPGNPGTVTLTAEEAAGLRWMVEEEKLAHDVYVAMYARWGLSIFTNISDSETQHVAAVRNLLAFYGLSDPSAGLGPGTFADAELQHLYDTLIAQGNLSLLEALRVGAAIEEIDILDLQRLLGQTNKSNIRKVYTNLMDASGNHLRAFVNQIERRTGTPYMPLYLTPEAYAAIIGG